MEQTLTTEPDAAPLAVEAAGFVADRIRSAVAANGTFTCAVSGGQTPWLMLTELAEHDLPWSSVGEPERNLTHLRQILGSLPVTLVPMPVTDPDLEAADGGYASRLPARFDLVHLGLGADGHIASLVPGDRSIPAARVQARRSVIFADAPAVDGPPPTFQGAIFDVDGVLVDSPHFRAWPRLAGALAALKYLMEAGEFTAYPDAIRFVLATKAAGIPIAAASSSKNADLLLRQVRLDDYVTERASPCSTCWTRTSPAATCRAASRIR